MRVGHAKPMSEEPFRLFVETVRDYGLFMLDPQGRIASWNLGAERIKGYSEAEALGRHFSTRAATPSNACSAVSRTAVA